MKKLILVLVSLMMVLMAGTGYAVTCAFNQAATTAGTSSTYIRGNAQIFNATLSGANINVNATTAVVSAGATGCVISGALTFNNTASNYTQFNVTVNTLAMRDDTACTFTLIVKNVTNQNTIATCTQAYISDNTKPRCIHSASSKTDYKPDRTWTVTGANASSATLQFGSQPAFTMSEASDVFTYTTTRSSLPEGTYSVIKAITNDGLNTTACNLDYVTIDSRARAQQIVISSAIRGQKQAEAEPIVVTQTPNNSKSIGVIVLIAVAGFWLIKRKK